MTADESGAKEQQDTTLSSANSLHWLLIVDTRRAAAVMSAVPLYEIRRQEDSQAWIRESQHLHCKCWHASFPIPRGWDQRPNQKQSAQNQDRIGKIWCWHLMEKKLSKIQTKAFLGLLGWVVRWYLVQGCQGLCPMGALNRFILSLLFLPHLWIHG